MAKKRRDKENDPSSLSKVAKVGAVALTLGGSVAAFNNSGLGRKTMSEVLPALRSTGRKVNKELRDLKATRNGLDKRTTATDIKNVYNKNKNTLRNEMSLRKDTIKLNLGNKNNLGGAVVNSEQIKRNSLELTLKDNYKSELYKNFIGELTSTTFKDKDAKSIKNLALNAYRNIKENTIESSSGELSFSSFLDKSFKQANFSNRDQHEFLTAIHKNVLEVEDKLRHSSGSLSPAKSKAIKIMDNKLRESKRQSDTIFGRVDALLNNSVDSELLFKGSKAATFKDIMNLTDEQKQKIDPTTFIVKMKKEGQKNSFEDVDIRTLLKNMNNEDGSLDNMIFDKAIRITKDGDIFSTRESRDMVANVFNDFSSSTLGKLFAMTDIRLDRDKSIITGFKAFSTGKEAAWESGNEKGNTLLFNSKLALGNASTGKASLYETTLDEFGVLQMSDSIAEGTLRNNRHAKSARLNKEMVGTNKNILTSGDTKLEKLLDINQTGAPNPLDRIKALGSKFNNDDWEKNILGRQKKFLTSELSTDDKLNTIATGMVSLDENITVESIMTAKANAAKRILQDNKEIANMLNSYTTSHQITDNTISSLIHSGNITDEHSLNILKILNEKNYNNTEELLKMITLDDDNNVRKLYNKDLEHIINRGLDNTDYILSLQNISQTSTKSVLGRTIESTDIMGIEDILRREAIKEAMLREVSDGLVDSERAIITKDGVVRLENILTNSNLDQSQSKDLRYLSNWSIMQNKLKIYNDIDASLELDQMIGYGSPLSNFDELMTSSGTFRQGYSGMLDDLSARHGVFDSGLVSNVNENYYNEYNDYSFMKESVLSKLSQVKDINDAIKVAGQAGRELIAGRNDMNNYTTLTQIPQFLVARLGWGVESLGLKLSDDNTGSTLDMMKNIGLKRILPAVAAISAYDYLNYESENFTGISITGAAANAVSNLDLAGRRLAYATGIGQSLDWFKETSVLGEYMTGSTDFQTKEEREDWYENGYSAVRGGRFWGFGSTAEYRGSSIQYYQPNYVKRAHSNYNEVGIYGSAEEKFKHSWLPSLRHPLSPLRAALDPYWLEKKNMDERPYPLTGKMFSEGTPWGAILNPTVGEILKPVRMLPEVKRRLGSSGQDAKNTLRRLNDKIRNKGDRNNDTLIADGTDIRSANYVPYANVGDGMMNIQIQNGKVFAPGIDHMQNVPDFNQYRAPSGEIIVDYQGEEVIDLNGEIVQQVSNVSYDNKMAVNEIVSGINSSIKSIAQRFSRYNPDNTAYEISNMPDRTQGTYVYQNRVNLMNKANSEHYYRNSTSDLVDNNLANSYLKDGVHSIKQLSGIYAFLGDMAFGEQSYSFKYEDAGQMSSFSRGFWDAQAGGLGGEFMEIARRFFPSNNKSVINYNPLTNTMPEWLPEKYRTGDAYAALPKGEMRMPGKGYETINDLHSDSFGDYGAFDRFKILADIAPTSEEYKLWRNIARNTVTDPELLDEFEEIQLRAKKMSSNHDFYDYRFVKNNVKMNKGVVKSIEGTTVELLSGEQLNLAGINLLEDGDVSQLLNVGEHINYRTSADAIKRLEDGLLTNAVIYKNEGFFSTNINKSLVTYGIAERNKDDDTSIGRLANASASQQTIGGFQELIAHANIPYFHNKFMKIETARESYANEHIYGTSFSTWNNPIKGFVEPMINRTSNQSLFRHSASVASSMLFLNIGKMTSESYLKYSSGALMAALNPSALLGMGIAGIWNLGVKSTNIGKRTNIEVGAGIGSAIGSIAWGLNNAENPLKATMSFAMAGESISKYLKLDDLLGGSGKGAMIGAAVGLGISALKNPNMNKDMFRQKWIPEATEKKYELDEYFDRLEYVKYRGLYNQASIRAFLFEDNINVKKVFRKLDKNKEKLAKLNKKAEELSNSYVSGGYEYEEKMAEINNQINSLKSQQAIFKGGKYTKAAVAYKKAMESTIYGMSEGATSDEILASVPDQYKDHFINFMNERSKSERKKILEQLPEYLRKPLQISWKEKANKVDSNKKFFKKHTMPSMAWKGWKPNVNLKHVKMKTIQNEGMLLSDFGYYESEKSKLEYHMASGIENFDHSKGGISYLANMTSSLGGLGVSLQNISVEPTSAPGLWVVGDIKQTVNDVKGVGSYGLTSGIQSLTSALF